MYADERQRYIGSRGILVIIICIVFKQRTRLCSGLVLVLSSNKDLFMRTSFLCLDSASKIPRKYHLNIMV